MMYISNIEKCEATVKSEWRLEDKRSGGISYKYFLMRKPTVAVTSEKGLMLPSDQLSGDTISGMFLPKISAVTPSKTYPSSYTMAHYYVISVVAYTDRGIVPIHPTEFSKCVMKLQTQSETPTRNGDQKVYEMSIFQNREIAIPYPHS